MLNSIVKNESHFYEKHLFLKVLKLQMHWVEKWIIQSHFLSDSFSKFIF